MERERELTLYRTQREKGKKEKKEKSCIKKKGREYKTKSKAYTTKCEKGKRRETKLEF